MPLTSADVTLEARPRLDLARIIDDLVGLKWLFWGREHCPKLLLSEFATFDES